MFTSELTTKISEISAETLRTEVSQKLNHNYLTPLEEGQLQVEQIRKGITFGTSPSRIFFSIPTRFKEKKPVWIHYIVVTGNLKTYLSRQALRALVGPGTEIMKKTVVFINGIKIEVEISLPGFETVNLLGMNFLMERQKLQIALSPVKQSVIQF